MEGCGLFSTHNLPGTQTSSPPNFGTFPIYSAAANDLWNEFRAPKNSAMRTLKPFGAPPACGIHPQQWMQRLA
jgi:hypothetical protein